MRHLVPFDEATKTIDPEVEISVMGTGGSLRAGSSSKTVRYERDDFEYVFLNAVWRTDSSFLSPLTRFRRSPLMACR